MILLGVAWAAGPTVDEPPISGATAPNEIAVVIANETYTGPFGTVPYAARDADAFASWLMRTRGLPRVNVARVHDASRRGIADAVAKAAATVPAGGRLWVYYAGHGLGMQLDGSDAPERVLLGVNALSAPDELAEYVVPLSKLEALAAASKAAESVFVVDASFNNSGRDGKSLLSGRFAVPVASLSASGPVTVWSASGPGEAARAYDAGRHGAFTWFAVGALSGWADGVTSAPDGRITLDEAQAYVQRELGSMGQTPQVAGTPTLLVAAGRLVAKPAAGPAGPLGTAFDAGIADKLTGALAAAACDAEATRIAEGRATVRADKPIERARLDVTVAWAALAPQRDACERRAPKACAALARFQETTFATRVDVASATETVPTACGPRPVTVAARTVRVWFPEVAEAGAWLERATGVPHSPVLGDLRPIPAGTYTTESYPRQVTLSRGYAMMATEVTAGMYAAVTGLTPGSEALIVVKQPPPEPDPTRVPAQLVSWYDAVAFANEVSGLEQRTACYTIDDQHVAWIPGCTGYRLPTEAEWERAALAGATRPYGGVEADDVCDHGNVLDRSGRAFHLGRPFSCNDGATAATRVARYRPNAYGLYDMLGNVSEWVWDATTRHELADVAVDPTGEPDAPRRVRRGGGFYLEGLADDAEVDAPENRANDVGFRLVRSLP